MTIEEMFRLVGSTQPYPDEYQGYWLVPPRGVVLTPARRLAAVVYLRVDPDGGFQPGLHLAHGFQPSAAILAYLDMLGEPVLPSRPIAGGYEAVLVGRYTDAIYADMVNATALTPRMVSAALLDDTDLGPDELTPHEAKLGWYYLLLRPGKPAQFYHPRTQQRLRFGRPTDLLEF